MDSLNVAKESVSQIPYSKILDAVVHILTFIGPIGVFALLLWASYWYITSKGKRAGQEIANQGGQAQNESTKSDLRTTDYISREDSEYKEDRVRIARHDGEITYLKQIVVQLSETVRNKHLDDSNLILLVGQLKGAVEQLSIQVTNYTNQKSKSSQQNDLG